MAQSWVAFTHNPQLFTCADVRVALHEVHVDSSRGAMPWARGSATAALRPIVSSLRRVVYDRVHDASLDGSDRLTAPTDHVCRREREAIVANDHLSQRASISTDGSVPQAWRPMGHARRHVVSLDGRVVSARGSVRHTLRTIISSVRPIPDTHLQARLGRCSLRLVESPLHLGVRLPRSSSWLPPRITGPLRLNSGSPRLAE